MKKNSFWSVCSCFRSQVSALILFLACSGFCLAAPGGFLSSETYTLTTNSASRTITVTNFPGGAYSFEWYPASISLNNRSSITGEILRVEHLRTAISNIMETNGTVTATNLLISITAVAISTNYTFTGHWYVVPNNDRLRITSCVTNGEIILNREIGR